ncbi:encapsulin-associated ferritin-like protein [Konateibacter massiliensis]|uniref:encapsulin-associated ferritin-like protein n=1 Tax=Konateibacter massiliensis TaxID=2002841 RepID=UPI000C15838D|nr:ferritin-like domain-containing protein [Konateibacter massiliensis]
MADHWTETEANLTEGTKNITRAIKTFMEELEAVMFYQQRVDVTTDKELQEVFAHNRDEEIEHACMTLEWLRRNMDGWDKELKTYLFTSGSLLTVEEDATEGGSASSEGSNTSAGLGIGKLK